MGINIADNFQYLSQKPLDGRTKYDTTAAMKAVPDSSMYDGCLAYCSGTDKTYQWKSTNPVDATLGRWREFAGEDSRVKATEITTMPVASADLLGTTYRYVGAGNGDYVIGCYYTCMETSDGGYRWVVHPSYKGQIEFSNDDFSVTVPGGGTSKHNVSLKGVYRFSDAQTSSIIDSDTFTVRASEHPRAFTFARLKTALKTYFDGIYSTVKTISALTDVNISSLSNGQVLAYDNTNSKWVNADLSGGLTVTKGNLYSTSEKMIGQWTDGRPLYQRTYQGTFPSTMPTTTVVATISNIKLVDAFGYVSFDGGTMPIPATQGGVSTGTNYGLLVYNNNNQITIDHQGKSINNVAGRPYALTIRYTKTTDSATSIGAESDYSTSEKIVGTWINSKTLYQITVSITFGTVTDGVAAYASSDIPSNIEEAFLDSACVSPTDNIINAINDAWVSTQTYFTRIYIDKGTNKIFASTNRSQFSNKTVYATIKYTKTS